MWNFSNMGGIILWTLARTDFVVTDMSGVEWLAGIFVCIEEVGIYKMK